MTERTLAEQARYAEDWGALTPLGRVASVGDVAGAVRFLLGPDGRHVSGQTLVVDGGWTGRSPVPDGY